VELSCSFHLSKETLIVIYAAMVQLAIIPTHKISADFSSGKITRSCTSETTFSFYPFNNKPQINDR